MVKELDEIIDKIGDKNRVVGLDFLEVFYYELFYEYLFQAHPPFNGGNLF